MACRRCGRTNVVAIELLGKERTPLRLTSCNHCDERSWSTGGNVLSAREAIALIPASTHGGAARNRASR